DPKYVPETLYGEGVSIGLHDIRLLADDMAVLIV
ncbi:MAG: hypothetical protein ACI81O_002720, partial [Cyclobacteriaceae bacterium]